MGTEPSLLLLRLKWFWTAWFLESDHVHRIPARGTQRH